MYINKCSTLQRAENDMGNDLCYEVAHIKEMQESKDFIHLTKSQKFTQTLTDNHRKDDIVFQLKV